MSEPLDFESALNPEQRAAALAPDGPVLVIAAAGTGKTRTLTWRVAGLVERGIDPQRMLLLTFTNRAAREMLDRARQLVGEAVGGIWGGTFHHLCNRILRRYADRVGYRSDYTILDQDDSRSMMRACVADRKLTAKHFPKPDVLLGLFSLARNREADTDRVVREHFADGLFDLGDISQVCVDYAHRKTSQNAMDFDDLLVNTLRLFQECAPVLMRYQEQFLHILVDEYQDTNPIQAHLVDALAARHRNLLVVGDDFQSIYSWRGADYRNFLSFPDRYPDTKVFKLETNYRSVPGVLDVANACIAGNPEQFQKTLRAVRTDPLKPALVRLRSGDHQAKFVIDKIHQLTRRGVALRDIAVLYRAHFHALELQLELAREGLPYAITSGMRFFEQAHVKDACSLLRLIHNPADELAFQRILGMFPRIGEKTAQKIFKNVGGRFPPLEAAARAAVRKALPAAAHADWDKISGIFADPADDLLKRPGEIVYRFTKVFYSAYAAEAYENYDRRLEDVDELINYTGRFASVSDFLNEVALLTNVDATGEHAGEEGGEAADSLLLSTIHQAKGLEWKIVFVLWLAEGMFPSGRAMEEEGGGGEAEERRLFYVTVTRAKDELYLCVPETRRGKDGSFMFYTPSRFVKELPPGLVKAERVNYYA